MSPSTQSVQPGSTKAAKTDSMVTPPPEWDKVLFAVSCARCGQDLHGFTEPVCPVCRLEFDWAAAVPVEQLICESCDYHLYGLTETRCPECGTPFTWEEALVAYHRNKNPLFEYQWRNRPLKSFFGTWLRTLRPKKFWQSVDIHDPPRTGSLIIQMIVTLLFSFATIAFVNVPMVWYVEGLLSGISIWNIPTTSAILDYFVNSLEVTFPVILVTLLWYGTTFCSLLFFRQSMRIYRIRNGHVFRVWVHVVPLFTSIAYTTTILLSITLFEFDLHILFEVIPAALYFLFTGWSIRQGFCYYLRIPHSMGVAVASMLIALLASAAILTFTRFIHL